MADSLIEEAVKAAAYLLSKKICPAVVKSALVTDGFNERKADTIVRWAIILNLNTAQNDNVEAATDDSILESSLV